jgi:hypothetical protein
MPNNLPKQVLIVGGGTAGWITAAMLARSWPKSTKITLIESPTIGRVGVGESTIPSMQTLIRFLGIDEAEFMRQTHATFKCTLHMVGWNVEGGQAQDSYHPLFGWREDQVEILDEWICDWGSNQEPKRFIDCFQGVHLAQHKNSPKKFDDGPHQGAVQYAYHLDAVFYDGIRDFIVAHYYLASRTDTEFWRANTSRSQLPALLEEVLMRWDHGDQVDEFLRKSASRHLVSPVSWYCILTSLNRIPKSAKLKSSPNPSLALKFSKRVEETIASIANFPDHWQYFRRMGSNRPLP